MKEGEYIKIPVDYEEETQVQEEEDNIYQQEEKVPGENQKDYLDHIVKEKENPYAISKMYG